MAIPTSNRGRSGPTRVVVLDDHPAVRLGLERVLQREPGLRLIAALEDERDLLDQVDRQPVDVVVLDYELARGDGLALCQRLKQRDLPPRIIIYTAYAGPGLAVPAVIAQADAVISKSDPVPELLDAIRRVARGERLIPLPPGDLLAAATAHVDPKDAALIPLLVHGATVADIAEALAIDEQEVVRRSRRVIGRLHGARRRSRPDGPSVDDDLHSRPHSRPAPARAHFEPWRRRTTK
jgi:DNA-binding NarL/FixJ family response regulator